MPRIGQTTNDASKVPEVKEVKYRYGVDRFVCPICYSVHWYPFKDGCHNPKCPYTGTLRLEKKI